MRSGWRPRHSETEEKEIDSLKSKAVLSRPSPAATWGPWPGRPSSGTARTCAPTTGSSHRLLAAGRPRRRAGSRRRSEGGTLRRAQSPTGACQKRCQRSEGSRHWRHVRSVMRSAHVVAWLGRRRKEAPALRQVPVRELLEEVLRVLADLGCVQSRVSRRIAAEGARADAPSSSSVCDEMLCQTPAPRRASLVQ